MSTGIGVTHLNTAETARPNVKLGGMISPAKVAVLPYMSTEIGLIHLTIAMLARLQEEICRRATKRAACTIQFGQRHGGGQKKLNSQTEGLASQQRRAIGITSLGMRSGVGLGNA